MDSFADFISNCPDDLPPSDCRPIKVAVIDDGIDLFYKWERFAYTFMEGQSFHNGAKRSPFYFSTTGHGTLMAELVQRICPRVHLYVARLDEVNGENNIQPTPESAAKVSSFCRT